MRKTTRAQRAVIAEAQTIALSKGETRFQVPFPCPNGHTSERCTADKRCVECTKESRHKAYDRRVPASVKERRILLNSKGTSRKLAKAAGLLTYLSTRVCPQGHLGRRYTSSGGCVECVKLKTREQVEVGYFKSHYDDNKEEISRRQKRRYRTDPEARKVANERSKRWVAKNKVKRLSISRQYKARRRATEDVGVDLCLFNKWTTAQPKVCFYCGAECSTNFHVDHFMPLSKGGQHVLTNLRIACPGCNLHKSAKLPLEWINEISANDPLYVEAA